jgi:hypothetical protein
MAGEPAVIPKIDTGSSIYLTSVIRDGFFRKFRKK